MAHPQDLKFLDKFTQAYLICAFWTNDESEGLGGQDYRQTHGPETMLSKMSFEAMDKAIQDCRKFQDENKTLLESAGDDEQNGHDFWLSRNGHGSGYFDRDYEVADKLQEAARAFGETDLYEGDDKKLYFSR